MSLPGLEGVRAARAGAGCLAGRRKRARPAARAAGGRRRPGRRARSGRGRALAGPARGRRVVPALRAARRLAGRARRPHRRHHRQPRRRQRRSGAARLHGQRDGPAACRRRPARPARRPRATSRRRRLRAVSEQVFADDPLRLLRLARMATSSDSRSTRSRSGWPGATPTWRRTPSGERILIEMRRLLEPRASRRRHPAARPAGSARRGAARGWPRCEGSDRARSTIWTCSSTRWLVLDAAADISAHPAHYLPAHAAPRWRRCWRPSRRQRVQRPHRPADGGAVPRHRQAVRPASSGRRPGQLHGPRPARRRLRPRR